MNYIINTKLWLKLLTLVTVYSRRESIMDNEVVKQHPGCCYGRLILAGNCWVYLEIWSVTTKIFSKPPFDRSRIRYSRGAQESTLTSSVLVYWCVLRFIRRSHCLTCSLIWNIHMWPKEALFDQRSGAVSTLMTELQKLHLWTPMV